MSATYALTDDAPHPLADALARLKAEGVSLPIESEGKVVAFLVTPEEMERIEDAQDLALLRAARAEAEGEPRFTLEEVAAEFGIELSH
jgi:hypothetical protein